LVELSKKSPRKWLDMARGFRKKRPPLEKKMIVPFDVSKRGYDALKEDIKEMRAHVETSACPICGNANLELLAYEKGIDGWECAVSCKSCFIKGIFNDGGFRIVKPVQIPVKG
jgi:hypothetical protein